MAGKRVYDIDMQPHRTIVLKYISISLLSIAWLIAGTIECAGWGVATHLYIAEHVLPPYADNNLTDQALYGSMLPDFDTPYGMLNRKSVVMVRELTHSSSNFLLASKAKGDPTMEALAAGCMTHNELWGADYYAHKSDPLVPNATTGYVDGRTELLKNVPAGARHAYIEAAIDLLVKRYLDPKLGKKVVSAARERRSKVAELLASAYSPPTFPETIAKAEDIYRTSMLAYGHGLAMRSSPSKYAMAIGLGAEYKIWPWTSLKYLEQAVTLCTPDFRAAIESTITHVSANYAQYQQGEIVKP